VALSAGQRLGSYEITAPLGAGGMGEVYRARDIRLERQVAIKLLPSGVATDPVALGRFEREARAVAALSHPNILAIYDFETTDGLTYAVTELLDGETLRARLASGALPPRKAVEIGAQIARGLAAAHDRQIVHRDIKPENVFVSTDGAVKILDFGLARSVALVADARPDSPTVAPSTEPGVVLGTVGYMAPEQVRGEAGDYRADIFSLGCVLYEMLAGRRPFQCNTAAETMTAILREDPPDPPDTLPPGLLRTVRRCLEKRPEERFQSARDLAFALESALDASSDRGGVPRGVAERRQRPIAGFVGGLLLGALAATLVVLWLQDPPTASAVPEFRRLTFDRGTVRGARFAADGQTVVYGAAWEGQPLRAFMTRTDTPESVPLDIPAAQLFSVSRTGDLALSLGHTYEGWMGSGTLARSSLLGKSPRALLEHVREAEWSPDGSGLAIVRRMAGFERLEFPAGRVLYQTGGWISNIRFSPAGDQIAFADHPLFADDAGGVAMVDLSGRKTTLSEGWLSVTGLAWHPETRDIWFSAARSPDRSAGSAGVFGLYALKPGTEERIVLATPAAVRLFDIAADGRVLLGHEESDRRVDALFAGDTEPRDVTFRESSVASWIADDGSALTITDQSVPRYAAYLLRAKERAPVRLGDGYAYGISPDGRWVVTVPVAEPRVLLHPIGPGQSRELPNPPAIPLNAAAWLPDGRLIAFGQPKDGPPRGYVLATDGTPPRAFTAEGVDSVRWWAVMVSPDGSRTVARMPGGVIVTHPVDGQGEPQPIRGLRDDDVPVGWSEDPKVLFVAHGNGLPWIVERLDLATGRRTAALQIGARERAGLRLSTLAISPNGRYYVHSYSRLLTVLFTAEGLR
jgi:eukaryotic-like serine/threonine-protein kinase